MNLRQNFAATTITVCACAAAVSWICAEASTRKEEIQARLRIELEREKSHQLEVIAQICLDRQDPGSDAGLETQAHPALRAAFSAPEPFDPRSLRYANAHR